MYIFFFEKEHVQNTFDSKFEFNQIPKFYKIKVDHWKQFMFMQSHVNIKIFSYHEYSLYKTE